MSPVHPFTDIAEDHFGDHKDENSPVPSPVAGCRQPKLWEEDTPYNISDERSPESPRDESEYVLPHAARLTLHTDLPLVVVA